MAKLDITCTQSAADNVPAACKLTHPLLSPWCSPHTPAGNCGHNFGQYCLKKWIKQQQRCMRVCNVTCPVCRKVFSSSAVDLCVCFRLRDTIEKQFPQQYAERKAEVQRQEEREAAEAAQEAAVAAARRAARAQAEAAAAAQQALLQAQLAAQHVLLYDSADDEDAYDHSDDDNDGGAGGYQTQAPNNVGPFHFGVPQPQLAGAGGYQPAQGNLEGLAFAPAAAPNPADTAQGQQGPPAAPSSYGLGFGPATPPPTVWPCSCTTCCC